MNGSSKPIICCGFTPCIQRILEFKAVAKASVNRALRVSIGLGGKGANTARMVGQLGGTSELIGFAGGANGRLLEALLVQEGVAFRHVQTQGETRICQTLVEAGNPETTELVEEMPPITSAEWQEMVELFQSLDLSGRVVTLSGKLPAGAPVNAYAQVIEMAKGSRVILDAPGEPLLRALRHNPFMVKINDVELFQTVGGNDLSEACCQLIKRGAQSVLITRGSRSSFFMDKIQSFEILPPHIDAVNPVGSGDAVTAGLAVELSRGRRISEAIRIGMACGASNALNLVSGQLNLADVERLCRNVFFPQ